MENISRYFTDIRKSKPLSSAREIELANRIQKGDETALNELVEANLRFVVSEARKYQGRGLELEDLISEGNIGLIEAARRFDPEAGFRFISYGVWWIRQSIYAALNLNRAIRLPFNKVGLLGKMNRTISDYVELHHRNPSDEELAKALEISIFEVRTLQKALRSITSLDTTIGDDEDSTLEDIIENKDAKWADNQMESESLVQSVDKLLETCLEPREAFIIRQSFGIDVTPREDSSIGKELGVSAERVRQLRDKALSKLRKTPKVLRELREYL